jgi:monofunctional biosynthetic peptidoglycan transglycosylase
LLVLLFRWAAAGTALMVERKVESWFDGEPIDLQRTGSPGKRSPTSSRSRSSPAKTRSSPALGLRLRRDPGGAGLQRAGGTVRGASTLSQQVSKNLFLWSGRSWLRKGLEAWFTGLIECSGPSSGFLRCISTASSGMKACLVPRRRRASLWRERQPVAQQASYLAAVLPNPRVERQPSDGLCGAPGGWIRQQMSQLGGTSYLMELDDSRGRLGRTHCITNLWERACPRWR